MSGSAPTLFAAVHAEETESTKNIPAAKPRNSHTRRAHNLILTRKVDLIDSVSDAVTPTFRTYSLLIDRLVKVIAQAVGRDREEDL